MLHATLEVTYQRFLAHYRDGFTWDRVAATVENDYVELSSKQQQRQAAKWRKRGRGDAFDCTRGQRLRRPKWPTLSANGECQ